MMLTLAVFADELLELRKAVRSPALALRLADCPAVLLLPATPGAAHPGGCHSIDGGKSCLIRWEAADPPPSLQVQIQLVDLISPPLPAAASPGASGGKGGGKGLVLGSRLCTLPLSALSQPLVATRVPLNGALPP
jgi:hypothetical protein|tara:strand:+ start:912 stop:1316 length:405 start_codon:yes stop_codon:yes gene_type:complete